jgi:urease accessory protein
LLGSYTVLASLYVITRQRPAGALVDCQHQCLAAQPEVLAGVSELPNSCGAAVGAAMRVAWNEARLALVGLSAPDLRKV